MAAVPVPRPWPAARVAAGPVERDRGSPPLSRQACGVAIRGSAAVGRAGGRRSLIIYMTLNLAEHAVARQDGGTMQTANAQTAAEQPPGGQPVGGQAPGGQAPGGQAPGGQATSGQAPGGHAADGQAAEPEVSFDTDPGRYRHWKLAIDGDIATLSLDVAEDGGLVPGYELKMNSYDLGVDIELYDAVQRLRFEHPEVRAVVLTSGKDRMFCAGANIRMLAQSSHAWKVNFCKFTNETRNGIEDAAACSGQAYIAALNGTAAGGGYELALACDQILLVDDGSSAVALPEVPLLGVLPGTGGLTRLVDKRHVRRDLADAFATRAEGVRGQAAVDWGLVDANEPEVGTWVLKTEGDPAAVVGYDGVLDEHADDWLVWEIRLLLRRVFTRLDYSARSLFALVEPGSCFAGTLAELALLADRSYLLDGLREQDEERGLA